MARKRTMTASLPPTPCTPAMREAIVKLADQQGRSIAEIQRDAMSLFLSSRPDSSTVINDRQTVEAAHEQE